MKKLSLKQWILIGVLVVSFVGMLIAWPFSMDIVNDAKTL